MGLSGYQPSHPSSWVYQDYIDNDLHLAKIDLRHNQDNIWVYQDAKEVERPNTKLVSSTPEL